MAAPGSFLAAMDQDMEAGRVGGRYMLYVSGLRGICVCARKCVHVCTCMCICVYVCV